MIDELMKTQEERMKKTLEGLKKDYGTLRAGRAAPSLLDKVFVDYYGTPTPVNQIASVTVPEARMIMIKPYEKNIIKEVEKAIQKSDLGLTPNSDGMVIRLAIPQLTQERRKELVKVVNKKAEDAKVAIRSIRRDAIDGFRKQQKDSEITEDELKVAEDEVQKITDSMIEEIDGILANKEKEVMSV